MPKIRRAPKHLGLGATGKFPRGKMHATDEGALRMAIGHDRKHGTVVVDFGTPVAWIGLPPDLADELADNLKQHAAEIRRHPKVAPPS